MTDVCVCVSVCMCVCVCLSVLDSIYCSFKYVKHVWCLYCLPCSFLPVTCLLLYMNMHGTVQRVVKHLCALVCVLLCVQDSETEPGTEEPGELDCVSLGGYLAL